MIDDEKVNWRFYSDGLTSYFEPLGYCRQGEYWIKKNESNIYYYFYLQKRNRLGSMNVHVVTGVIDSGNSIHFTELKKLLKTGKQKRSEKQLQELATDQNLLNSYVDATYELENLSSAKRKLLTICKAIESWLHA